MAKGLKLGKKQRLKSRKQIDALFEHGVGFPVFPLRIVYLMTNVEAQGLLQMGVSVSKRSFKKAVDRNRIKRLMRETYRLNKLQLEETVINRRKQIFVFFIFLGKELPDFESVSAAMKKGIIKLEKIVMQ